ncbi:MAG: hypothetical protein A2Z96_01870 [Spirochaetes bacterium GWB1_48_6]|nr:MAG: hypothetical protein A2Z96_01870 [Spirochaetes bacterium GWB1_48_6]
MSGNLRARLSRIRENPENRNGKKRDPKSIHQAERICFPAGWSILREGLRFKETLSFSSDLDPAARIRLNLFSGRLDLVEVSLGNIVFFDLETTGLSGGAGTVAFLAAFGNFRHDGTLSVRQYFIDDYPSELDFLQSLAVEFTKAAAVVTYNGSSFDMPLYSVRRTMNELGPPAPVLHIDALHAARRLWRRTIGNCALGNLEAEILGIRRGDDLPGSEVPEVWFEYLKFGRTKRLERVFLHNELDVRSLAALFLLIHNTANGSMSALKCDPVGLAELQSRIDETLAEQTLVTALCAGITGAARPLMKLYGKQLRLKERTELVPMLPDDPSGLFSKSVYAERICGDIDESIRLARQAGVNAKGALRDRALRRVQRLMQKLSRLGNR